MPHSGRPGRRAAWSLASRVLRKTWKRCIQNGWQALLWSGSRVDIHHVKPTLREDRETMSDLAVENTPAVAASAHEAARGQVIRITEQGQLIAAIVPPAIAALLERLSPDDLAELLEDFADIAAAREARASIEAGEALASWEEVKAEAGLA
jgi:hypothetical protein